MPTRVRIASIARSEKLRTNSCKANQRKWGGNRFPKKAALTQHKPAQANQTKYWLTRETVWEMGCFPEIMVFFLERQGELTKTGVFTQWGVSEFSFLEVRVHPAECGEQLGRDPSKIGSSKSLVLKRNTLGLVPGSLPHAL